MSSVERYVSTITLAYFRHLSHAILTPRYIFKDQFRHPDECHGLNYTGFAKTLSSEGALQNLPEGKLHVMQPVT